MKALLIVYDNQGYMPYFPMGIAYIAEALREIGVEVTIWNQDITHEPDSALGYLLSTECFDMVGLSLCGGYYQYNKLKSLSNVLRGRGNAKYILGGHMPVSDPEYFLKLTGADCIVVGEGEETIQELVRSNFDFSESVKGIAYLEDGKCKITQRRPLCNDLTRFPAYDLFDMSVYRLVRMPNCASTDFVMPMLSGRGCIFECNFCMRMDKGFRARTPQSILEEVAYLKYVYGINYISFGDELLMSSIKRTEELCRAFIDSGLNFKWDCNGRLNFARKETLQLMKDAGCVFINYGIEAFDNEVLKNMNKCLTVGQITTGIENTLAVGISPGFNIIWGNIGDNERTLDQGVEFLLKYDDCSQLRTIRPVTPYPGSPLFDWCVEQGLIKDTEEFYEKLHKNSDLFTVDVMGIGIDNAHRLLKDANKRLLDNYYSKQYKRLEKQLDDLYIDKKSFRGWRQL